MLAFFLTIAAPQEPPAPVNAMEASEIVVVGNRLKSWKGKFAVRGTKSTCRTTVSTGDAEIDAIGCEAMTTCLPPMRARIIASDAKSLDRTVRKQMKSALSSELAKCSRDRRDALVVELVDRRFEARQGRSNAQN